MDPSITHGQLLKTRRGNPELKKKIPKKESTLARNTGLSHIEGEGAGGRGVGFKEGTSSQGTPRCLIGWLTMSLEGSIIEAILLVTQFLLLREKGRGGSGHQL